MNQLSRTHLSLHLAFLPAQKDFMKVGVDFMKVPCDHEDENLRLQIVGLSGEEAWVLMSPGSWTSYFQHFCVREKWILFIYTLASWPPLTAPLKESKDFISLTVIFMETSIRPEHGGNVVNENDRRWYLESKIWHNIIIHQHWNKKKLIRLVPADSKALKKWDMGEAGHDTVQATGTQAPDSPSYLCQELQQITLSLWTCFHQNKRTTVFNLSSFFIWFSP